MQYSALRYSKSKPMLVACILAFQLSGCGSGGASDALLADGAPTVEVKSTIETKPAETAKATEPNPTASLNSQVSKPQSTADSTATFTSSDPRVIFWVDPRNTFSAHKKWDPVTQIHGPNKHLATEVSEPGFIGANSDYAFLRTRDPLDSSKAAFRHRLSESFPTWGSVGATRSEISANWTSDGTNVMRGVDYWVAFAVKFEPDMFGPGNGGASLLEFHQVPDSGESWLPSSFNMYTGENGMSFHVRWDTAQPSISKNPAGKTIWSESSPSTAEWHWIVMKVRLHWDATKKPYTKIWRAVGDGPLTLLADYQGPNDYRNNAPYIPQKFGIYRWDSWSGKSTRTMYTKGLYIVKDGGGEPAADQAAMLNLLRGI